MNQELKAAYWAQIDKAKQQLLENKLEDAFRSLQVAHVLGQKHVWPHTVSHLYMLKIGWLKKDAREIMGQLLRIPLGILGSLVGIVPSGNTGGSDVSMYQRMDIPADIKELLEKK